MPSSTSSTCTHDLGPGTSVCLRCRQERREAIRSHQQRLAALGGAVAIALVALYVVGASAANAVRVSRREAAPAAARTSVVASSVASREVRQQGEASGATPAGIAAAATAAAPPAARPAGANPHAPVIREGRTDLPDGLFAERSGDDVFVSFDTPGHRTRRRDKFEGVVRRTLPLVFGARLDSLLATIPAGGIVGSADLLDELPERGVHLRLADGWTLDLWPETRPGQDGPLVVRYRTRVTRD